MAVAVPVTVAAFAELLWEWLETPDLVLDDVTLAPDDVDDTDVDIPLMKLPDGDENVLLLLLLLDWFCILHDCAADLNKLLVAFFDEGDWKDAMLFANEALQLVDDDADKKDDADAMDDVVDVDAWRVEEPKDDLEVVLNPLMNNTRADIVCAYLLVSS